MYTASTGNNNDALHHFEGEGLSLHFQDGPIAEVGVNGTTNEEVIKILIERLNSLNSMHNKRYACDENGQAIKCLEEALMWLEQRTNKRKQRGVEGKLLP